MPIDLSTIQSLILDMDGVLWRASDPIGNLPAIFAGITRRGWKVALATNNATRSIGMYVERMAGFGVTVEPWQIINSAQAVARLLKNRFPQGGPIYIIGERGLLEALQEQGFYPADEHVLAVAASMDRSLSYDKLRCATLVDPWRRSPLSPPTPTRTIPHPRLDWYLAPGLSWLRWKRQPT